MEYYRSTLAKYCAIFTIVPVVVIGVLLTYITSSKIYGVKLMDTQILLKGMAEELVYHYEILDTDAYVNSNGDVVWGDMVISGDYSVVDRLKSESGTDLTLFFGDTRIATTILKKDGSRNINTKAEDVWYNYVIDGKTYFNENIKINGDYYFGYYIPLHSSDGRVIGMGFAGIPKISIQRTILGMIIFNIVICLLAIGVFLALGMFISNKLLGVHNDIMDYMREINRGVFIHDINPKIRKRNDEYGVLSRYMVEVNDSIKKLVSYDVLTGLLNRRAAMAQLEELVKEANTSGGSTFCLVIGDIDFFKKVNDTYGHSCGDNVLKMVSKNLNTLKPEDGFTARWGGEEFLIALKGKLEDTLPKLQNLYNAVKVDSVEFEGKEIKVTMTFGISEYIAPSKLDVIITNADILLYKGKESGRNKIVT